jgi:hypothetical protein
MMARSTCSNQRPDTLMQDRICQVDETSCNARPDHTFGSSTAMARTLMAQPVYPQFRKYPCVPAHTLRANSDIPMLFTRLASLRDDQDRREVTYAKNLPRYSPAAALRNCG